MLALAIHPCDVAFGLLSINAEVYYAVVQRGKIHFQWFAVLWFCSPVYKGCWRKKNLLVLIAFIHEEILIRAHWEWQQIKVFLFFFYIYVWIDKTCTFWIPFVAFLKAIYSHSKLTVFSNLQMFFLLSSHLLLNLIHSDLLTSSGGGQWR